jgi:hypothetical protein
VSDRECVIWDSKKAIMISGTKKRTDMTRRFNLT